MEQYSRDKRSPSPSSEKASRTFRAIRAKDTKPELIFRKLLQTNGLKGYRLHWKIPGRPDIAFVGKKVAIFVHGCYWHRCPSCGLRIPKSNSGFWQTKFEKNVERDRVKEELLKAEGWKVFVFWECDVKRGKADLRALVRAFKDC